jgi:hypothetical protein
MADSAIKTPPKNRQIEWRRFWCPIGSGINCGEDGRGFLVDPEGEYGEGLNPNVHELDRLIPESGPLILCGDPGIGKTHEFRRLKEIMQVSNNHDVLALTFRLHISSLSEFRHRTVESAVWNEWRTGDKFLTLMIDGVDEGLIRIPTFISALLGLLEGEPIARLRLLLTCRSAEWPDSQGDALIGLWPAKENGAKPVYELCPLRFKDVQLAAKEWLGDADEFAEAIWKSQVTGLATRPVTLFLLLNEFLGTGSLPSSHRELYRKGTWKLIGEVDPARLEILRATQRSGTHVSLEERYQSAQLLAALLLCCGKGAISRDDWLGGMDEQNTLPLTRVLTPAGMASSTGCVDALESALFTSVGHERFGFAHQTFAECLGSMQLSRLPLAQVRRLLMQRDEEGEHVIPQLVELAAWTAGGHNEFCEHLLKADPAALLHCDASILSGQDKRKLVDAILSGVKSGRILDDYVLYRFFHTLKHPSLADQLRPWIADKSAEPESRSVAIEIAERCMLSELADDFLAVANGETGRLREDAAEALCEVMPASRLAELEPLARGEVGPDPRQTIRGYALKRLVPARWSLKEALPHIRPRSDTSYFGSYHGFLEYHLPKHVRIDDLPDLLVWLRSNLGAFDSLSSRKNFAKRVIGLALENLQNAAIARAFVDLWHVLAKRHLTSELATTFGFSERLGNDEVFRRSLVSLLLNCELPPDLHVWTLFHDLDVVRSSNDFEWLLKSLLAAKPSSKHAWAEMIASHAHTPELLTPSWDKFLNLVELEPALRSRFEWLRAWDLDEKVARSSKARHLRDMRWKKKMEQRRRKGKNDPVPIRENALLKARENPAKTWWSLWHVLHWGDDPWKYTNFSSMDVEAYEGWNVLSTEEKRLVRACAREFLLNYDEDTSSWQPGSEASLCSTSAIWLLKDELEDAPALVKALSERWIRLFSGFHFNEDHGAAEHFAILDRINHQAALGAMMRDIEADRPRIKRPFAIRIANKCWDSRYDLAMQGYGESLTDGQALHETIDEWRELSAIAAGDFAVQCLSRQLADVEVGTYPIMLKAVISAAILSRPVDAYKLASGILMKDADLAESVWSTVFHDVDTRENEWWSAWSEDQLADLFIHLLQVLPQSGDPNHDVGFVAPRTSAAWARDQIPSKISGRSSRAACHALLRLSRQLPERGRSLRWSYHKALVQCRRNEWERPNVSSVLKLIGNSAARMVVSDQDLLDAVLESLERLQHHLTGMSLPAVGDLWEQIPAQSGEKAKLQPCDEKTLQHRIARWLRDDLASSRGIIVNCEVEPRLGQFTDIFVDAVRPVVTGQFERVSVVIEVKGCWHAKVKSAMHSQLVDGYLRGNGLMAGIYLVGWFVCEACPDCGNPTGMESIKALQDYLSNEVACYDGKREPEVVAAVALDCRWPQGSPSQTASNRTA